MRNRTVSVSVACILVFTIVNPAAAQTVFAGIMTKAVHPSSGLAGWGRHRRGGG